MVHVGQGSKLSIPCCRLGTGAGWPCAVGPPCLQEGRPPGAFHARCQGTPLRAPLSLTPPSPFA
eukprot:10131361-Lingulodinium_polyedra.AAC.1